MSYILEALKKAQAERQLGSTPGIHDAAGPAPVSAAPVRNPKLWIALVAALLLAGGAAEFLRSLGGQEPAPPVALAAAPVAPPMPPAPAAVQAAPAVAPAPKPAAPPPQRAPVLAQASPVQPAPQPQAAPVQAPQPEASADDALPTLAMLPSSISAGIPRVTLGGYIYSAVPSERLLLVDKDLRREGEEVAPGLVLEKLLPAAAVMNYRGTRFRMPY